ncbi:glutathione ABC transporter permease GsiC [Dactylosporangium fulvum]|uniref:ABC transporter permease n=1 Tax=Dactylosporangium fulvum TaxID=53359 RepID=A0ABY5WBQ7_9ACTN|nr:ABC transporter permease [Dactylosporangium fulvum]UWP86795.1 ABC transporter permease [Dactylosporangium fulvum]
MNNAVVRRCLQTLPVLFLVSVVVFSTIRLIPGDPVANMVGADASAETIARVRAQLGLDQPIYVQYWDWLTSLLGGDFGQSLSTRRSVLDEVAPRALATLQLTGVSMLVALLGGVLLGILAAYNRGHVIDRIVSGLGMLCVSVPSYWVGMMLVLLISVQLGLLPTGGNILPGSMILPVAVLTLPQLGMLARLTRGTFIDILEQDYVRTARQKGLPERRILLRHALPNGGVTILTFAGVQLGHLLAGAVVVEVVFAWPGLGRLAVDSLLIRDLPVVQATILLFALTVLVINLVTDLLYTIVDPRIGG